MQLRGATASHVGNVRESNQDRAHFGGFVAVVADGMGGHQGGEMAASIAIGEFLEVADPIAPGGLVTLVEDANRAVFERAAHPDLRGMGTTLVALTLRPNDEKISVVNVGDSRAYKVQDGELVQVTVDHSLVEDLVRQNRLSPSEAQTHPQRNILTRALGIASEVEVDRFLLHTRLGDRFLLCSDGLFNEVSEQDILGILADNTEPNDAADALVAAALQGAARDNITVAVVDVVEDGSGGNVSSAEPETLQMPAYDPAATAQAPNPPAASAEADTVEAVVPTSGALIDEEGVPTTELPPSVDIGSGGVALVGGGHPAAVLQSTASRSAVGLVDPVPTSAPEQTAAPAVTPVPVTSAPARRRRLAPVLFTVGVLALAAAALYYVADFWAGRTWYIDTADALDEELVLVNGRPDGFWILAGGAGETAGGVLLSELNLEARQAISEGRTFSSRDEAAEFIVSNREPGSGLSGAPAEDVVDGSEPAPGEAEAEAVPAGGGDAGATEGDTLAPDILDDLTEGGTDGVSTTTSSSTTSTPDGN